MPQSVNSATAPQSFYGNSMTQIGGGPAGMLYSLSNEMIKIYNQLQALYKEISLAENAVQKDTITAAADGQRAAAQQQANALYAQAAGAFAGGLVSVGGAATEYFGNRANNAELSVQNTELNRLNELNAMKGPNNDAIIGPRRDSVDPLSVRRDALLNNDTEALANCNANMEAADIKSANEAAIKTMSPEEFKPFKQDLQKKVLAKEKTVNTAQNAVNSNIMRWNLYKDMVNSGANATSQGVQGYYTTKGGEHQATQQVASAVKDMGASVSNNAMQQNAAAAQESNSAIATAKAGATAYANT